MDYRVVHCSPDTHCGQYVLGVGAAAGEFQAAAVDEEQVGALARFQRADVCPAQYPGAAPGGDLQQLVARGSRSAAGKAMEEVGGAQLLQEAVAVVAGAAVQGQAYRYPQL